MVSVIINSTTSKTNSSISHIASTTPNSDITLVVFGIIVLILLYLTYRFAIKPYLESHKNKPAKKSSNSYFKHLFTDFTADTFLNGTKLKQFLKLPNGKPYRIISLKEEKLKIATQKQDDKKEVNLFVLKIRIKSIPLKYKFLFITDLTKLPYKDRIEYIYMKEINFYSLGEDFIIEAMHFDEIKNYLENVGLFRISYTNLLNNLEETRKSERIVENSSLVDKIKLNEDNTQNLISTYKSLNEFKKI